MGTLIKICCARLERRRCPICVVNEDRVWPSWLSALELSSAAGVFIVWGRYEKRVKFDYSDQEKVFIYTLVVRVQLLHPLQLFAGPLS